MQWARPRGQSGATVDVKTCYGTVDGVSSSYVVIVGMSYNIDCIGDQTIAASTNKAITIVTRYP